MIVGYLLFVMVVLGLLLIGLILLGFLCGVYYMVMVFMVFEFFGLWDFGMIYNFMMVGFFVVFLFFFGVMVGYFYDKEVVKFVGGVVVGCEGFYCFSVMFLIMVGVCLVGLFVNIFLMLSIKFVY